MKATDSKSKLALYHIDQNRKLSKMWSSMEMPIPTYIQNSSRSLGKSNQAKQEIRASKFEKEFSLSTFADDPMLQGVGQLVLPSGPASLTPK